MKKKFLKINNIPSVLWGKKSEKVIIGIHGNMSNKEDVPIEILSEVATNKGYQVLSFDLPKHGDRKNEDTPCKICECVNEFHIIMEYAKKNWKKISLFANSMGAYFSLIAYKDENLQEAFFLSPVLNMKKIIEDMMDAFNVSEEELKNKKEIVTPIGEVLYYDYYTYVKSNPIEKWRTKTSILCGSEDNLCDKSSLFDFAEKFSCDVKTIEGSKHYFHTESDLKALSLWLDEKI